MKQNSVESRKVCAQTRLFISIVKRIKKHNEPNGEK